MISSSCSCRTTSRPIPGKVYDRALAHVGAPLGFRPPDFDAVRFSNRARAERGASPEGYGELTEADRVELYEYYRDDIAQLEEMLGCSLDRWRPDLDPARGPDGR